MSNMKIENWKGFDIRFVEVDGEWWAILKDICDALNLRTAKVAERLSPDMMERVPIEGERKRPSWYGKKNYDVPSKDLVKSKSTFYMIAVNENGIYEALFASRRLEARQFRQWTGTILSKLRKHIGLEGYEIMRMADKDVQEEINCFLEDMFYDDERDEMMISVTVQGGDVDQVPLDEYLEKCREV